ncbi:MAG TPA: Ku protein [Candidatus Kapabacteria bacterium]|nr:Ku protein [Candidatus Kapabacteria bacterium]
MRPIWKGAITFGLVSIPVKVVTAVRESTLDLDMLDSRDLSHIKYKRVNEETGKEVPFEQIVKGYKYKGDYVVLEEEDFIEADVEKSKTIDIINFVDESEIETIYYEQPYYLEPEEAGKKAYGLLRDALADSGKVGVTLFVMRKKESLAILRPYDKVIVLDKIRFEEEIVDPSQLDLPPHSKARPKELAVAKQLIDQLTEEFDITSYKDTYSKKLLDIIHAKATGKRKVKKVPKPRIVHHKGEDLMATLKASLTEKKRRKAA